MIKLNNWGGSPRAAPGARHTGSGLATWSLKLAQISNGYISGVSKVILRCN